MNGKDLGSRVFSSVPMFPVLIFPRTQKEGEREQGVICRGGEPVKWKLAKKQIPHYIIIVHMHQARQRTLKVKEFRTLISLFIFTVAALEVVKLKCLGPRRLIPSNPVD